MGGWVVDEVIHFGPGDLVKKGLSHFGFYDRAGNRYAIFHQKHFLGLVGRDDRLEWTVGARGVFEGVPNIVASLNFPMYVDCLADGALAVSNFGDARIYRVDVESKKAVLWVEGSGLGMVDVGNCVVDDEGSVWVNEVRGCRVWRFDGAGKPVLRLGDGTVGFQRGSVGFDEVRFSWIYDLRRGPDGNVYVLDSRNFAVRMIDLKRRVVVTLAGTGKGGYGGDGGEALEATFGSSPGEKFDGPISLSLDERGDIFVGDRQNRVVRMIDMETGVIETIAGNRDSVGGRGNDVGEKDPFRLNLPEISSMDYYGGRLFVPTDLAPESGDLAVLRRVRV